MKRAGLFACLATALSLAGCILETHEDWDEPGGHWNENGGSAWGGHAPGGPGNGEGSRCSRDNDCRAGCYCSRDNNACRSSGSCTIDKHCAQGFRCDERRTCVPGDRPVDAGVAHDTGSSGGMKPPVVDAGAPDATPPLPPADGGNTSTGSVGPPLCRIDAQCAGGRCFQGACQRPCGADATCGTGQVCRDGFCQGSAQPGGQCVYSAECGASGVCINGFCHPMCEAPAGQTATCANPADRCQQGVCRPDTSPVPQCTASAQCPMGRTCVDAICRTPCRDDGQCGPGCSGTVCHAGSCVMPEELVPPPMCPAPCATAACCATQ